MKIAVPDTKLVIPRPPEYKALSFRVKAVDDQRYIIEGILNAIGNIDDGDDRTMPNAFKKTLNDSYSRKSAQHLDFLWPYLWNHDPSEPPIGGIFDGDEVKSQGDTPAGLFIKVQLIPDIERARNVYSCFKSQSEGDTGSSGLLRQSMGYKTIRSEYVPEKIDGQVKQIRNLLEVQVWEGSACVFPMNEMAVVTAVKSGDARSQKNYFVMPELEEKTVCGDTSLPIGPRDESWDGSAAKKQIFSYAEKEDGTIDASKAKKCFLQVDGDTGLKGSYGYPFVNVVDGSPRINVGGIKACAGALSGSRGADTSGSDVDGMKRKVATIYSRINKAYPDAEALTPPWNEKDKASDTPVDKKTEKKDFNTLFMAAQAADALEDWGDLVDTLTQTMMQAFCMGDQPQEDMRAALEQFGAALMSWCDCAVQCGLPDYLGDRYGSGNSAPYVPYSMRIGGYDSMSRHSQPEGKIGARISAPTKQTLRDHADALKQMATEHKTLSDQLAAQQKSMYKAMNAHADMLEQKANDLTDLWKQEGQGDAFTEDNTGKETGKSNSQAKEEKRREPSQPTLTRNQDTQPVTTTEEDEIKALEAAFAGWMKK